MSHLTRLALQEFRKDVYKHSAAHILDKNPEDVTPEERRRAKEAFFVSFHAIGAPLLETIIEEHWAILGADIPEVAAVLKKLDEEKKMDEEEKNARL